MEEAIKYGHFLKRSEEDITEAIDIYKTLGNKTFYGPEEEDPADQHEQRTTKTMTTHPVCSRKLLYHHTYVMA